MVTASNDEVDVQTVAFPMVAVDSIVVVVAVVGVAGIAATSPSAADDDWWYAIAVVVVAVVASAVGSTCPFAVSCKFVRCPLLATPCHQQ